MDILFNDLSLHGQFGSVEEFCQALSRVMKIRGIARSNEIGCFCHMSFAASQPVKDLPLQRIVNQNLSKDQARDVMTWLAKGPHWDSSEHQKHDTNTSMKWGEKSVSGHAPAEAAMRLFEESSCGLMSLVPSDWTSTPLVIDWTNSEPGSTSASIPVENWLEPSTFEGALANLVQPVQSWSELEDRVRSRFNHLVLADDSFANLKSMSFDKGSSERILQLFEILNRLASEHDHAGSRTPVGHEIYEAYFVKGTWFSGSSDSEEQQMTGRLTFPGPDGERKLYPWHGKVNHPDDKIRVHFGWPMDGVSRKCYVPYIGPKLTKR